MYFEIADKEYNGYKYQQVNKKDLIDTIEAICRFENLRWFVLDMYDTTNIIAELMTEKRALEKELESYQGFGKTSEPESKLNEISHITEIIENQPLQFDDNLIRQMLECVVVQSKEQIKIVFKDGTEVDQPLS